MSEHFIVSSGDNSGHRGVVGHVAAFYRANGLSAGSVLAVAFSGRGRFGGFAGSKP